MPRQLTRILICTILGALTTIIVAWERAMSAPGNPMRWRGYSATDESPSATFSTYGRMDRPEGVLLSSQRGISNFFPSIASVNAPGGIRPSPPYHYFAEEISSKDILPWWTDIDEPAPSFAGEARWLAAFGWPAVSMCYMSVCGVDAAGTVIPWTYTGAIDPKTWSSPATVNQLMFDAGRFLPLRPVWPGFAIDALFYGSLWFALACAFVSAKRRLRTFRGRCPRCAYDLRGRLAAGCPECGWNRAE